MIVRNKIIVLTMNQKLKKEIQLKINKTISIQIKIKYK